SAAGGICLLQTNFFFQAEDGIRGLIVTGVQTCALPILTKFIQLARKILMHHFQIRDRRHAARAPVHNILAAVNQSLHMQADEARSEERRVGKEGRTERARERSRRYGLEAWSFRAPSRAR